MNENLKIYRQLEEVPAEAQKKITGGRLSGMTDIKPMWRIEKLTETFGMCGIGWYTETTNKEIIEGANEEKIAVVDIKLYVKIGNEWTKGIEGSGGSSFVAKESKGLYTSDECFKMAYTDALSVACKSLGMGAKVYWGDSKYDTSKKITTPEEARSVQLTFGKHKGETIGELVDNKDSYINYLFENGTPEIKQAITILTGMVEMSNEEAIEKINTELEITEAQKTQIKDLIDKETIKLYLQSLGKTKLSELTWKEANKLISIKGE